MSGDLSWITNFIWGIADDVLRDLYVRGKYRLRIPMMPPCHSKIMPPGIPI